MDAVSMLQFQQNGSSGGALAGPPGLDLPTSKRKVSFADARPSPDPRLAAGGFALSQHEMQSGLRMQRSGEEEFDVKFCVHCGTKVAEKLMRMKNRVKFCVQCGQRHPENFMEVGVESFKAETPNEDFADLIALKKKMETLKAVDTIAQLIAICDAQLKPAASQGQIKQQQSPGNQKVIGEQCRQSPGLWRHHGAFQQHAGSAYQQHAGTAYACAGHSA